MILLDIILKGLAINDVTFQVPVQSSLLLDEPLKEFQVLLAVRGMRSPADPQLQNY